VVPFARSVPITGGEAPGNASGLASGSGLSIAMTVGRPIATGTDRNGVERKAGRSRI
jgi:hypothetical protein